MTDTLFFSTAFPDDDRLEYDLNAAVKKHAEVQGKVNAESRSAELLAKATKAMGFAYENAREALSYSTFGMFTMCELLSYSPRQNDAHRYLGWWNVRSLFCTVRRCNPHLFGIDFMT
jgi:hypothetical protein